MRATGLEGSDFGLRHDAVNAARSFHESRDVRRFEKDNVAVHVEAERGAPAIQAVGGNLILGVCRLSNPPREILDDFLFFERGHDPYERADIDRSHGRDGDPGHAHNPRAMGPFVNVARPTKAYPIHCVAADCRASRQSALQGRRRETREDRVQDGVAGQRHELRVDRQQQSGNKPDFCRNERAPSHHVNPTMASAASAGTSRAAVSVEPRMAIGTACSQ